MDLNTLIDEFLLYLEECYTAAEDKQYPRPWCTLGMTGPLTQEEFRKHFDRKALNEDYVKKYKVKDIPTKEAIAFIKAEIDLIYGFHKAMVERHKTRLQFYREDAAMKRYHIWNSINIAYGKFLAEKRLAERPDLQQVNTES
jgi:hypothetical protein